MATTIHQEEATIRLRIATVDDLREIEWFNDVNNGHELKKEIKPKLGQCYWVKSIKTGKFMNRHYIINDDTDWPELKNYFSLGMIYVPVNDAWLDEEEDVETETNAA